MAEAEGRREAATKAPERLRRAYAERLCLELFERREVKPTSTGRVQFGTRAGPLLPGSPQGRFHSRTEVASGPVALASWRAITMNDDRPPATADEVATAIWEIRAYHDQGRQSLRDLPSRGKHGARTIDEQAERLGWNSTRLRKARQFAHREEGYSRKRLNELCRLLRAHSPVFGISHVGLLVTVPWPEREAPQRACVEGNWSTYELVTVP